MNRPFFMWLPKCRHFNIHSSRDCCRVSITIGPLCFRWTR